MKLASLVAAVAALLSVSIVFLAAPVVAGSKYEQCMSRCGMAYQDCHRKCVKR